MGRHGDSILCGAADVEMAFTIKTIAGAGPAPERLREHARPLSDCIQK
jgi:hypothetical protein